MNLAVSNIAWPACDSPAAFSVLRAHGVDAVEVAPTTVWPEWTGITAAAIREFRRRVEDAGLEISSLQSILFQKPALQLFGAPAVRQSLLAHMQLCASIAAQWNARYMVFGAPRNRDRGGLTAAEALQSAAELFSRIAETIQPYGVGIAFEPNPEQYGCNFATDSSQAAELVRLVDSPAFGLHLDTACMHLAGEDAAAAVAANTSLLTHFHVSEPNLGPFAEPEIAHAPIAESLAGYRNWISLEMRAASPALPALDRAVQFFRSIYGR